MQGLVVVGLIFEEIPNINIKCVKVTGVHNIQYSFHDGYIIRSNARSRKRLNPTLFPRLSHAKPTLNPRSARAGISCSVKTITLTLASTHIQAHLMQSQVKMLELSERKILNIKKVCAHFS